MRSVILHTFNDESFRVIFSEDGEPIEVHQTRTVWSKRRGSPSQMISARVREIIRQAKADLERQP